MFSLALRSRLCFERLLLNQTIGYSKRVIDEDPKESLFAKILSGDIKADKVFEDDKCLAFNDINPQAPIHILIIPKQPIGGISALKEDESSHVGHLFYVARKVAEDLKIDQSGYRLTINDGSDGQQTVRWLHVHLMGGRQMTWPPG